MDWFLYDNGLRHERVNMKFEQFLYLNLTQPPAFTCAKLTIEHVHY